MAYLPAPPPTRLTNNGAGEVLRLAIRNTQFDPSSWSSEDLDTIHFSSRLTQTPGPTHESAQDDTEVWIVRSGTDLVPSSDDTNA